MDIFYILLHTTGVEESKQWIADPKNRICDAPGSWYCALACIVGSIVKGWQWPFIVDVFEHVALGRGRCRDKMLMFCSHCALTYLYILESVTVFISFCFIGVGQLYPQTQVKGRWGDGSLLSVILRTGHWRHLHRCHQPSTFLFSTGYLPKGTIIPEFIAWHILCIYIYICVCVWE